ncbi:MAG: multicopper oxidase family protein [Burkholderiales bacterium]|nr:multicopper oxidase family protein [Burkholderiales bacterium]
MGPHSVSRRDFVATLPMLLAGCALRTPAAATREFQLDAAPAVLAVDPQARAVPAWAFGGSVPGPLLRARQGERLRVVLRNALPQATTVHWHGVRVPNAMDGVPHLTQPPVPPGGDFRYEFQLPDAGTYWYHSHLQSAEQVERGLYGVLVVEEREPPAVDRDLAWVLDDWRLTPEGRIAEGFLAAHDVSHAGRIGNVVTLNGSGEPPDLVLRRGERVRLRLLNAANGRIFGLQFEGHAPRIIALDGQPVAPHEPARGRVVLGPGMRCDLVLDATAAAGRRYAVRDTFYRAQSYDLVHIAYPDAPLRERPPDALPPLAANPLPEPDLARAIRHEIVFEGGMMGGMHRALLDGSPRDFGSLLRQGKAWAVNGVVASGHGMAPLLTLPRGGSVVLAMRNDTRWHHPIHLHGHTFRVLTRGGRATTHREWQDTVLMEPMERVEIAFVADNPGDWMFHCHILEHQEGGMMAVVRVL